MSALKGQNRIRLLGIAFSAFFAAISLQLGQLTLLHPHEVQSVDTMPKEERSPRPDIVDRNGRVLATDLVVSSLFADPRKILDVDEAVELLTAHIPELDAATLRKNLKMPGKAFVWLRRQVTPDERDEIYNLGIPGVGFVEERKRVYPLGRLAAHMLGNVDVDTHGIAGIEKFLDDQGAIYTASLNEPETHSTAPAQLSIDIRVQQVLTDEVAKAVEKFHAKAGGGIIEDIDTGEILGLVSLPDYNPNAEDKRLTSDTQNKMTSGVYELGSVIKAVTFAMAFDYGTTTLKTIFDTGTPLAIGKFRIHDLHVHKAQTVQEIFTNSSNIGTAKMALQVGLDNHMEFLKRVGLMDRLITELPESAKPLLPHTWSKLSSATAAFGHGFAVQPLQGLSVISDLINGGMSVPPTFLKRSKEEADALSHRIIKPETSEKIRFLFRANVEGGTGGKADVPGYRVGGKTGTAEKVVNGRYSKDKSLSSFIGAFPMDHPRYSILVMLDEPGPLPETFGFTTAGWNAVPTAHNIIARVAPILGVEPVFTADDLVKLAKQKAAEDKLEKLAPERQGMNETVSLSRLLGVDAPLPASGDAQIAGLTADSREVKPGFLFAALQGVKADGAAFIDKAFAAGAVAAICKSGSYTGPHPVIAVDNPRHLLALMAARFYDRQPDTIVAVTGTNGKTSVTIFVRQIWEVMGFRTASLGTIGVVGPSGSNYVGATTPDPVALAKLAAELRDDHVSHLAIEASSHGLDQNRLDGLRLTAGAFTNLTRDHLDYHGTLEKYFAAKLQLFTRLLSQGAGAVINMDSDHAPQVLAAANKAGLAAFRVGQNGVELKLLESKPAGFGQMLTLETANGIRQVALPLAGDFQVSNALVAAGLVIASGGELELTLHALESLKGARGRLELVGTSDSGGNVFVDYAHTPDALENALRALRPTTQGKLIVVFGCGGDRDKGKRPLMGAIASRLADHVIVTDDNPRSEAPEIIRREILGAAPKAENIGDRASAIKAAVDAMGSGDVLLVAGKGHEEGQQVGAKLLPFVDHDAVRAALAGEAYHG